MRAGLFLPVKMGRERALLICHCYLSNALFAYLLDLFLIQPVRRGVFDLPNWMMPYVKKREELINASRMYISSLSLRFSPKRYFVSIRS